MRLATDVAVEFSRAKDVSAVIRLDTRNDPQAAAAP
jgi:hypothetical protein